MSESAVGDFGTGANRFQARLYQTVPDCEESEAEHLAPAHWCCVDFENVPGRWVAWCVEHDSALVEFDVAYAENACDDRRAGVAGFCRWHPQGAFIPEEAELPEGRWVSWCVAHGAMGWGSPSSGCANPAAGTKPCRWHPQGAFIPEEADDE